MAGGVAICAPSVAMTMVVAGIYPWLRRLALVRGAIAGVVASFSGLLVSMVVGLARPRGPDSLRWSWVRRELRVAMEHSRDHRDRSGALGIYLLLGGAVT